MSGPQTGIGLFLNQISTIFVKGVAAAKLIHTQMFAKTSAGNIVEIEADTSGSIRVTLPAPGDGDNFAVALGYTGDKLTTITKNTKVKTLTWTGDNLTNISAWV